VWCTSLRLTRKNAAHDRSPRRLLLSLALLAAPLALAGPQAARAAEPAAEPAPALTAVAPAEFGAGATITVTGSGFVEGDELLLDSKVLTDVKVTATGITATVPEGAKAGKKLTLRRGKQKPASTDAFTFVKAPKLTSASPKFAAPGETVKFKGSNLAKVTELTLAGKPLAIAAQTDKAIEATVPEGLQTGPVAVKSVGGTGGLKKDYEVFYAPTLAAAEPAAAFEGDPVVLKGAHLDGKVKFKLGGKPLKVSEQAAAQASVTVAKGAKSGTITAKARGKLGELAAPFTVHPTPKLTAVPREVGAPGELKVSGKHLDAVTTWRLGQVELTPAQAATGGKVLLVVPPGAPGDQPLVAVSQGREFTSKKPVGVVMLPVVHGLAFWPDDGGEGVDGVVRGADFSEKTKFTLAGKPLKTRFVAADRVEFSLARPPKGRAELKAKAGKLAGAPVTVDGDAGGYRVAAAELAGLSPGQLQDYGVAAAQLDLEVSQHLLGEAEAAAPQAEVARTAALGLRLGQDLQRVALAQAAVCATMTAGKGKDQAAANGAAGETLRVSQRHAQSLLGALEKLWKPLGPDALASAGLAEADAAVAAAAAAQAKVQAACKNKYHGSGQLVTEAATTVKLDVDKLYRPAILGAFAEVLAKGKSWAQVEKEVGDRLAAFPAGRRKLWTDTLKATKGAVEAGAAPQVTGKGAKGDKHVDPKGKPKGTGKGGKAK
jgi:hypothetical protein